MKSAFESFMFYETTVAGQPRYFGYFTDHLGSVVTLYRHNPLLETDPNSIVEQYTYDAYGNVSIDDTDNRYNGNQYMFNGRRYDAESGLYYYRARMYNPELGVFQSQDHLGYIDSMNLYAYCANNPLSYTDPWGTDVWIAMHGFLGWHANLNVGEPDGRYTSYGYRQVGWGPDGDEFLKNTFDPRAENFLTGEVYQDKCHEGGFVNRRYKTSGEQDQKIIRLLDEYVGRRWNYFIIGANCHAWTNSVFDAIGKILETEEEENNNGMRPHLGGGIWL
ncbi:MAG: RHS repeat-associated core domain-containing protein [Phycisphaerae bacterium]|jgi:RHS repeat-associated protein